jgi:hypothetical protein
MCIQRGLVTVVLSKETYVLGPSLAGVRICTTLCPRLPPYMGMYTVLTPILRPHCMHEAHTVRTPTTLTRVPLSLPVLAATNHPMG